MANDNNSNIVFGDSTPGIILQETPSIDFGKSAKGDFVNQLDELANKFKQDSGRRVRLEDVAFTARVAGAFENPLDRAIRQAQELIAAKKYNDALIPLGQALQLERQHPEALYLVAYCQAKLEQPEQALTTLLSLRSMRLETALAERVQALKDNLRGDLMLLVLLENALLLRAGKSEVAASRMQHFVELDPDFEIYYYLLGGSLMTARKFEQALAAVETGIRNCAPASAGMLQGLKPQIMERYAGKALEPARMLFKKGQSARARENLNTLPKTIRATKFAQQFEQHLAEMERKRAIVSGRSTQPPALPNAARLAELDDFYFFLVGEETREGSKLLERKKFQDAQKALATALGWAPDFPYANYLYANAILGTVMQKMGSWRKPSREEVESAMGLAYQRALIGALDPEIKAAQALAAMIQQMVDAGREGKLFAPLAQEFGVIMTGAKKGIQSREQLTQLTQRMTKLKEQISSARPQIKTPEVKKQLQDLSDAVDRNMKQLQDINSTAKESDIVNGLAREVYARMEAIKQRGGLRSWEKSDEQEFFQQLRTRAQQASYSLSNAEAKKQMTDLLNGIDNIISQLY